MAEDRKGQLQNIMHGADGKLTQALAEALQDYFTDIDVLLRATNSLAQLMEHEKASADTWRAMDALRRAAGVVEWTK